MSRVSDYAYINARLRARIGIMRSSAIIDEMIKAPNLVEAVAKLDGTRHQHIAEVYRSTGDLEAAELSLIEEQVQSCRAIVQYLPSGSSSSALIFRIGRPSLLQCTFFTLACLHGSYSGSDEA